MTHCGNRRLHRRQHLHHRWTIPSTPRPSSASTPSIAIGADGLPVISHQDVTAEALRVTHCGNAACTAGNSSFNADDPVARTCVGLYTFDRDRRGWPPRHQPSGRHRRYAARDALRQPRLHRRQHLHDRGRDPARRVGVLPRSRSAPTAFPSSATPRRSDGPGPPRDALRQHRLYCRQRVPHGGQPRQPRRHRHVDRDRQRRASCHQPFGRHGSRAPRDALRRHRL